MRQVDNLRCTDIDASTDLWMVSSQSAHINYNMHEMSRESEMH